MKLSSLELENFRQYYGKQKLDFSKVKEKNITVIFGENGSGKTALLNSFLWVLYGKMKLPQSGKIVSERAMIETGIGEEIGVTVTLMFEHEGKEYMVQRERVVRKRSDTDFIGELVDESLLLSHTVSDGKKIYPRNPNEVVDQIMPSRLSDLFFFHGEDIDRLSREEGSREIQENIKNIMDLEILERSISHLGSVAKRFEKEMEEHGGEELKRLLEKKRKLERNFLGLKGKIEILYKKLQEVRNEKNTIDRSLKELEKAKELQEKRERLEYDLNRIESSIKKVRKATKNLLSEKAYLTFADGPFTRTQCILEEKKQKKEIRFPIEEEFVDNLLNRHRCICGRELIEGSEPFRRVKMLREKAGPKGLDEQVTLTLRFIRKFSQERERFMKKLQELLKERDDLISDERRIEEQISEIGEGFEKDEIEIKELEMIRKDVDIKMDNTNRQIGAINGDIEGKYKIIQDLEEEIKRANVKRIKGLIAQKRFIACKRAQKRFERLYQNFADTIRERVQKEIGNIYYEFIRKPYKAVITDDYKLEILKEVGVQMRPVAMSTAERQIASLAFIGGLVGIAKEQYEKKKDAVYFKGGMYPIIMDSPFGYLDSEYRRVIGKYMPILAGQIVVLVADTQWEGDVEEVMKDKAGKIYQLVYYKSRKDSKKKYEYTVIKEVK
jgi:DNA sulfur modification protein DndD